jgi:PAS domain S-box-containing protein
MVYHSLEHLHILILRDPAEDIELIEQELSRTGQKITTKVVDKKDDFEYALCGFNPDVILSDHSLPEFNSLEALHIVKEFRNRTGLYLPFILLTKNCSEELAIQSVHAGADDYVMVDRLKRLRPSILKALEKGRLESERRKYLDQVIAGESIIKEAENLAKFGTWQVDLLTDRHHWSDEVYRIYGYQPGQVAPDSGLILNHIVEGHREEVIHAFQLAIKESTCHSHDFSIVDNKGVLKFLQTKLIIERNEDKVATRLTGFIRDISDIKNYADQLEKSEQEYKSLFEQNPDAVFSLDLKGKFTNANNALAELTGYSKESLLKMNFHTFFKIGAKRKIETNFLKTVNGSPMQYEAAMTNGKGKEFTVHITNMPIVVDGRIVGVHGIVKDITKKKHLESLVRKVSDLARIGGWEVDLLNKKVRWTKITRELHEVDHAFVPDLEKGIEFYCPGTSRETIKKAMDCAITRGTPWDEEFEIITAKGNRRWVRVIGEAEILNGKCIRLYGSLQDIHARKQAENILKETLLEKNNILESIGDAFFAVDKNWTVTYWNKVASEKLSMPKENILGKNLWDVFKDAISLQFYHCYHKAVLENRPVHFEEYYEPNGIWVEVSAYPSPSGLSVYFRDITSSRMQVQAIAEQNKKLRDIAWFQSHKVRAPLARIMGLIDLVKSDHQTKLDDVVGYICESAQELDTMIREIVLKTAEIDKQTHDNWSEGC